MTKPEFLAKVESMLPDMNKMIMERASKAFDSGALDTESYEDNFVMPKIFMSAMGKEIEFQYRPFTKSDQKSSKNLQNFL